MQKEREREREREKWVNAAAVGTITMSATRKRMRKKRKKEFTSTSLIVPHNFSAVTVPMPPTIPYRTHATTFSVTFLKNQGIPRDQTSLLTRNVQRRWQVSNLHLRRTRSYHYNALAFRLTLHQFDLLRIWTSGSAMAEGPRDALVSRNSATTKYHYRMALFAWSYV